MSATVLTIGTFDLYHPGHAFLFEQCSKIAGDDGRVVVGLNTDSFVYQFKDRSPIQNFAERKATILSCRYVDDVVENTAGADAKPLILSVFRGQYSSSAQAAFLVIGQDWADRDYYKQLDLTQDWLDHQLISLLYVPRATTHSSTDIKTRVIKDAQSRRLVVDMNDHNKALAELRGARAPVLSRSSDSDD